MARGKICIGYCRPASGVWLGAAEFYESLQKVTDEDWRTDKRIKGRRVIVKSGPTIDKARNDMVRGFLAHPESPEWLLMIDADMTFTIGDVRKVFQEASQEERPVVGGLCFADDHRGGMWPTWLRISMDDDGPIMDAIPVEEIPRDALCKVEAIGAAFLLVHREVFLEVQRAKREDHPAPWFAYTYLGRHPFGEDVSFCLALGKLGISIYGHSGVRIGHVKPRIIGLEEVIPSPPSKLSSNGRAQPRETFQNVTPLAAR